MNRNECEAYITGTYSVEPDHPWADAPEYAVFRHPSNRKWFALAMTVPRRCLGLSGEGTADILNVKCDPVLIGSFLNEQGVYPAYHMSKTHWISLSLDGELPEDMLAMFIGMSYDSTNVKTGKKNRPVSGKTDSGKV